MESLGFAAPQWQAPRDDRATVRPHTEVVPSSGPRLAAPAARGHGSAAAGAAVAAVVAAASSRGSRGGRAARSAKGGESQPTASPPVAEKAAAAAVEKPALTSFMQAVEGLAGKKLDNPFVDGPFAPVSEEVSAQQLEVVSGAIPADFPDGLYVRNGPNPRFPTTSVDSPLGRTAHHWFEGDGMLHSVRFAGGSASFRNRYVRTDDFLKEEAAGEALYRPTVQVSPPASILNAVANTQAFGAATKDVANTNIIYHGGRLLAITEGAAMPTEVSPKDLSTTGSWDFGAQVKLPSFTAHPRIDPKTGELIFASYSFFETQTGKPGVYIGVVGPDGVLKHSARVPSADRNTLMHDCAITEKWTVITDFPLTIDPSRMFSEEGMIAFEPKAGARLGLVPRFGDEAQHWFDVRTGYAFHLLNAYEDGDDVVVRGCRADTMDLSFKWEDGKLDREAFVRKYISEGFQAKEGHGKLHEWRLHLKDGTVTEREVGAGSFVDFPVVNPTVQGQKHRFGYCSAFSLDLSIEPGLPVIGGVEKYTFHDDGKVTTERHVLPEGFGGQEVAFVPRPGGDAEDDGWLLMFAHNTVTNSSELFTVDAQNVTGPPVARLALPQRVPFGFHGTWAAGV